jgi:hypothetical protein
MMVGRVVDVVGDSPFDGVVGPVPVRVLVGVGYWCWLMLVLVVGGGSYWLVGKC